jgi:hypothetical protein
VNDAADLAEAVTLITTAGAHKGYAFTHESVAQALSGLLFEEQELSESDLLAVAGGIGCWNTYMNSNFICSSTLCG